MSLREFEGTERFVVRRKIGAGGMGVVYEAYDRARGVSVALKRLSRVDAHNIYRMKQEFRALVDVSHPNLAQLHELVFEDGTWFFTMELVDGTDFLSHVRGGEVQEEEQTVVERPQPLPDTLIRRSEPLKMSPQSPQPIAESSWDPISGGEFSTVADRPVAELSPEQRTMAASTLPRNIRALSPAGVQRTREALRQLAEGMLALHDSGKLHRDIKPSNVMVTKDGRVVLLDFGLVTDLYEEWLIKSTMDGLVCGTIAYMAPEQGAGMILGPASDWYAVGVMLFEALTGHLPFEGKLFEILMAKQQEDARRPRELVPDVPGDLDRLAFDLLRRDPNERPRGQDVLARLGGGDSSGPTPVFSWQMPSLFQDFVGREKEILALEEIFSAASSGRPAIAHVLGRSGMGKTALVRRFLDRLTEQNRAIVFAGRCYERELVPYKAMDTVIDALSRYLRKQSDERVQAMLGPEARALSRIFPVLTRVDAIAEARKKGRDIADPLELRRRAFAALGALFRAIAEKDQTPVIFIDDAQWGDGDSAALLGEMTGGASAPPILVVLAYRNDDRVPSPLVRALEDAMSIGGGEVLVTELPIGPLSLEESERLARALLPADLSDRATSIARESGGSPLFVQELASFGGEEVQLDVALSARFKTLSEEAQRLLAVLAAARRPIAVASANRAAGLSGENRAAIGILRNARLVRVRATGQGDEAEVYHDRIAEAVLKGRSAESMRLIHVALLAELERAKDPDPEALVVHLREAGELRRAGELSIVAAHRAEEALAFDRAASLLEISVQLADATDTIEWELRRNLGDALVKAGRGLDAADAYLGAAAVAPVAEAIELKRCAAESLLRTGYIDRGTAMIREVLRELEVTYPETHEGAYRMLAMVRIELMVRGLRFKEKPPGDLPKLDAMRIDALWSAATGFAMVDSIRAAYFHSRGMSLALRAGDRYRFARALAIEACVVGGSEASRARAARILDLLQEMAKQLDIPRIDGVFHLATGFMMFLRGEWKGAIESLERSRTIFEERCTGVDWELDTAQSLIISSMTYRGDVQNVPRRVYEILREAERRKNRYASTLLATSPNVSVAFAAAGKVDEARRRVEQAIANWSQNDFSLQHYHAVSSNAVLDLYEGEYLSAWTRLSSVFERARSTQLHRLGLVKYEAHFAHARVALAAATIGHEPARLIELAREDAKEIEATGMTFAAPVASLVRAQIAAASGEREKAEHELTAAIDALAAADLELHRAAAAVRLGELRGGSAGAALVREAHRTMKARGVVDPSRMTAVFAPVRWR